MTYLIAMDGFEGDSWKNILTLVEPSFYSDKTEVYFASQKDVSILIEEIMPIEGAHLFIFLVAQLGEAKEGREQKIEIDKVEKYRLKRTIEKIKKQFPYVTQYNSIVLSVDDHKHIEGSEQYEENEKQIAYELDRSGYIDSDFSQEYFFDSQELRGLDDHYQQFKETYCGTLSHPAGLDELKRFEEIKSEIKKSCTSLIDSKKKRIGEIKTRDPIAAQLDKLLEVFHTRVDSISIDKFDSSTSVPSNIMGELLLGSCSLRDDLNDFTIIEYPYGNEFDIRLFLNIVSMISLIHNSDNRELLRRSWWIRVDTLDVDTKYLLEELSRLAGLEFGQTIETDNIQVELNNTDNISSESEIPNIVHDAPIRVSVWYSKKEEDILKGLINTSYSTLSNSINEIEKYMTRLKKNIHAHSVVKRSEEYTVDEIKNRLKEEIKTPQVSYHDTIEKIKKEFNEFEIDRFIGLAIDEFQKTPSFTAFFGLMLLSALLALVPYAVVIFKDFDPSHWHYYIFFTIPFMLFTVVGVYYLVTLKKPLKKLLKKYHEKISALGYRIEEWQNNIIKKYNEMLSLKLENENRMILQSALKLFEDSSNKKKYHANMIRFINDKAKNDIGVQFGFQVEGQHKEINPDINLSAKEIEDYSLFREKRSIEISIDTTLNISDIKIHGYLSQIKFKKILGWNDGN